MWEDASSRKLLLKLTGKPVVPEKMLLLNDFSVGVCMQQHQVSPDPLKMTSKYLKHHKKQDRPRILADPVTNNHSLAYTPGSKLR